MPFPDRVEGFLSGSVALFLAHQRRFHDKITSRAPSDYTCSTFCSVSALYTVQNFMHIAFTDPTAEQPKFNMTLQDSYRSSLFGD